MPQAGAFSGQDHFDFEFSLSGQLLFTHHTFDGLLRGNTHLLEVFPLVILNCSIPNLLERLVSMRVASKALSHP